MRSNAALIAALALAACSQASSTLAPAAPARPEIAFAAPPATKIEHLVIMVQENRSFDNFFATFPGADGTTRGQMRDGSWIPLAKHDLATPGVDLGHMHPDFLADYDGGKMDGFNTATIILGGPAGKFPYQYVDPKQIAPYWSLAKQYVLADHMFATQSSGSFTAHQDLIAGGTAIDSTHSIIDAPSAVPWGCDAPSGTTTTIIDAQKNVYINKGPFPCFHYSTLRDLLDRKHVSWKYYALPFSTHTMGGFWNAFDAISSVRYSKQWQTNVSMPATNIFKDVDAGALPAVSWVIPDAANSDHPGPGNDRGPSWVARVIDAIGQSPLWNTTAVVVIWDDWGGFYDHVAPPQLDYQGLGMRVPCLIVSPYSRKGYVSHTRYEFGSLLRFIEENWNLGSLNTSDARAKSIANVFNFKQKPRAFVPISAKYSRAALESAPASDAPVDDE